VTGERRVPEAGCGETWKGGDAGLVRSRYVEAASDELAAVVRIRCTKPSVLGSGGDWSKTEELTPRRVAIRPVGSCDPTLRAGTSCGTTGPNERRDTA